ncbi:hypothetical protein [Mesorhizobium amorphae]|uniref:hypothetical protein n=1 Tax=Mesorhizobium amorphae TaxID=71433 RepID=UPI0011833DAE|nr:hypothetical protein [Mesorhizobium amorphae]
MSDLARYFVDAGSRGEALDLRSYSQDILVDVATELADSPQLAEFVKALLSTGTDATSNTASDIVGEIRDPGAMAEIARFLSPLSVTDHVAQSLQNALLRVSGDRGRHHSTRSYGLLSATHLAQNRPSLLRRVQSHLLEVTIDDDGDYLRHVARVVGLVLAHVRDDDLFRQLELLVEVDAASDEACFALGLLAVAKALAARDADETIRSLADTQERMKQAIAAAETRTDAALYLACIEVLLHFQRGDLDEGLGSRLTSIRVAAFEYSALLLPSNRPLARDTWLGGALIEGIHWADLATRLAKLDLNFRKRAWLDAARIIEEELARIFVASKSFFGRSADGGIETIVRPRIIVSLQQERSRLDALDQWLEENPETAPAPIVAQMRGEIAAAIEASLRRSPIRAAAVPATVATILASDGFPANVAGSATEALAETFSNLFFASTDLSYAASSRGHTRS